MTPIRTSVCAVALLVLSCPAWAEFTIAVDYTYDTNNFFDTQAKRDAMQAVADRYGRIISSSLDAVSPSGTSTGTSAGWRVGFTHPGTGASYQLSTAASSATDPIVDASGPVADGYGFSGLLADTWILYVGGRDMGATGPAGQGGTGTGTNFTGTFDDLNGPLHRGVIANTPGATTADLPAWGGSISFNTQETWHFDPTTVAGSTETDFYSIALHEVGHVLGLATSWNQWQTDGSGHYTGADAIAAYNADNGTSLTQLNLESTSNPHWEEGAYESYIFPWADPDLVGTVGSGLQDLLMEPTANFIYPTLMRLELTNVEVAALQDIGWDVIPEPASMGLLAVGAVALLKRRHAA